MSKSDIAVSVRGLSKSYTIAHEQEKHVTLAETMLARLKNPLRSPKTETFWALKDINFDIKKGDVVGIIGRNGAGKSTLLKILSRITEPTTGRIDLYGRVGSLLEVGTGFHPELTGRENIFLNGAILGMTKAEIAKQFDAIVDFAGVEKFLDTPVKRYSSGMYVRLAFAVAAHLDPEILVVDEVLAVGDIEFQKKCLGKMKDVSTTGRTVLFVSHNLSSMSGLCTTGILLRAGRVKEYGSFSQVANTYTESRIIDIHDWSSMAESREGSGELRFCLFEPTAPRFTPTEPKRFRWRVAPSQKAGVTVEFFVSLHVNNEKDICVSQCDSRFNTVWLRSDKTYEGTVTIRTPWLVPGDYVVDIGVVGPHRLIDRVPYACGFAVDAELPYKTTAIVSSNAIAYASVLSDFEWSIDRIS